MTIEKNTARYELLIRFDEDGQVKGSHEIHQTVVRDTDTGEVLSSKEGPAQPVDPASVSDVLGEHNAALVAQVASVEQERDDVNAARDAVEQERDDLASQVSSLTSSRDGLQSQVTNLETQVASLTAERDALQAQVDAMPAPTNSSRVTFRQLLLGLMADEWITAAEAETWASRSALPSIVEGAIASLPADDRPAARVTAHTMTEAYRTDPLLVAAATAAMPEADAEQVAAALDASFDAWSEL